jgi:Cytochrome c554 and c-prime
MEISRDRWSLCALATGLILVGGCQPAGKTPAPPAAVAPSASSTDPMRDPSDKVVERSGADPYFGPGELIGAVVLVSRQQNGYLEPCGCTEGQSGGLGRRQDLINRLRSAGRPVVAVDLGSLIEEPSKSRGGPDQVRIKLGIALRALKSMEYAGIALSPDDLRVGLGDFFSQYLNIEGLPPLISANVSPAAGLESILKRSVEITAGPRHIGITAIVDPKALEALADAEKDVFFASVEDPAASIGPVLAELEETTDSQILLVHGSIDLAKELASQFPGFDAVVATSEYVDPPVELPKPETGRPLFVQVGQKGQHAGLIGLAASKEHPPRYRDVRLDTKYLNAEPIKSLIDREFVDELAKADVLSSFTRLPHPTGGKFVGAETCKSCHPKTFEKWSSTKHALMAYQAIQAGPRGDRSADAECVSCHTTGFTFEAGFVTAEKTPWLKNQQCENCHGPASKHISDPTNEAFRKEIAIKAEEADRSRLCIRCHDADNDPHWDFKVRWPQIEHTKLDKYDDPKVREGLDVEAVLRALTEGKAPLAAGSD